MTCRSALEVAYPKHSLSTPNTPPSEEDEGYPTSAFFLAIEQPLFVLAGDISLKWLIPADIRRLDILGLSLIHI